MDWLTANEKSLQDSVADLSVKRSKLAPVVEKLEERYNALNLALNSLKNEITALEPIKDSYLKLKEKVIGLWDWLRPIEKEIASQQLSDMGQDFHVIEKTNKGKSR